MSVDQRKSLPAHFKTQYEDIWKFRYLDIRYDANYDQLIQGKVTYAGNGQSICTQFENIIVYKIVTPLVTPYIGSDKSRSIDQRLKNYPDLRKYFEGILDSFENKDKGT